ncbi:MAG: hypothetical protein IH940_11185 [Acidobacteria bacterium]|nr:hypothetical protein [Acidobacteriota bacterium]
MKILAIDVGSTTVRAIVYSDDGARLAGRSAPLAVQAPNPGSVEFDAKALASSVTEMADALCTAHDVDVIGITNQRSSTVLWDPKDGEVLGPAIGWQDNRTMKRCAELNEAGIVTFANQTPTKAAWLWDQVDPGRVRDLRLGTIDSWLTWCLSGGAVHVSDVTNMAAAGLLDFAGENIAVDVLDALSIPHGALPTPVPTSGEIVEATALERRPRITALAGDQQASLVGHGCRRAGDAKLTVGSGLSLDVIIDDQHVVSGVSGCFPIVAWRRGDHVTRGFEAIDLSGGSTLEWLCDLGLFADPEDLVAQALEVDDAAGVVVVPSLSGFGTPSWDVGATGAIYGLTLGVGAAHLARAALLGIAMRAAELFDAAVDELGHDLDGPLALDGGLTRSHEFTSWVADACGHSLAIADDPEVTSRGAATLAAAGAGLAHASDEMPTAFTVTHHIVEPQRSIDRSEWNEAVRRTRQA